MVEEFDNTPEAESEGPGLSSPQDSWRTGVEDAVAQQKAEMGDPTPWSSGRGSASQEDVELHEPSQRARRNGTTLAAAVRDYDTIEQAGRQHPLLGIEAYAQRMGWNPRDTAYLWAAEHGAFPQHHTPQLNIPAEAAQHLVNREMENIIAVESAHPKNAFMKSKEFSDWGLDYINQPLRDGRTYGQYLRDTVKDPRERLRLVAKAYKTEKAARLDSINAQAIDAKRAARNERTKEIIAKMADKAIY